MTLEGATTAVVGAAKSAGAWIASAAKTTGAAFGYAWTSYVAPAASSAATWAASSAGASVLCGGATLVLLGLSELPQLGIKHKVKFIPADGTAPTIYEFSTKEQTENFVTTQPGTIEYTTEDPYFKARLLIKIGLVVAAVATGVFLAITYGPAAAAAAAVVV